MIEFKKTVTSISETIEENSKVKSLPLFTVATDWFTGSVNVWRYGIDRRGEKVKCKYNNKKQMTYKENSMGTVTTIKYRRNGKKIRMDYNDGVWETWNYDRKGLRIVYRSSGGFHTVYRHDKNGSVINKFNSCNGRYHPLYPTRAREGHLESSIAFTIVGRDAYESCNI